MREIMTMTREDHAHDREPVRPEGVSERLWDRYVVYFESVDDPVDFDTWLWR